MHICIHIHSLMLNRINLCYIIHYGAKVVEGLLLPLVINESIPNTS